MGRRNSEADSFPGSESPWAQLDVELEEGPMLLVETTSEEGEHVQEQDSTAGAPEAHHQWTIPAQAPRLVKEKQVSDRVLGLQGLRLKPEPEAGALEHLSEGVPRGGVQPKLEPLLVAGRCTLDTPEDASLSPRASPRGTPAVFPQHLSPRERGCLSPSSSPGAGPLLPRSPGVKSPSRCKTHLLPIPELEELVETVEASVPGEPAVYRAAARWGVDAGAPELESSPMPADWQGSGRGGESGGDGGKGQWRRGLSKHRTRQRHVLDATFPEDLKSSDRKRGKPAPNLASIVETRDDDEVLEGGELFLDACGCSGGVPAAMESVETTKRQRSSGVFFGAALESSPPPLWDPPSKFLPQRLTYRLPPSRLFFLAA